MSNITPALYVATPCFGGFLHQGYVASLLGLSTASFPIHVEFYGGDSLISRARNILASRFLRSGATNLLFIDADISGFTVDHIIAMIDWSKSNPGVVAGRYRAKCELPTWVGVLDHNQPSTGRFRRARFAGAGFMMVPRSVIERLMAFYPERKYAKAHVPEGVEGWAFFEPMVKDGVYLSEDFGFCELCRTAGIDVWLDMEGRLIHTGLAAYSG
jgi:hypothetical protein